VESAVAWRYAVERTSGPTSLLFSRQALPHQSRSAEQLSNIACGGYLLNEAAENPDAILIATGSEVALAMDATAELATQGVRVNVVSMPSVDTFMAQSDE
jgi:transketolase